VAQPSVNDVFARVPGQFVFDIRPGHALAPVGERPDAGCDPGEFSDEGVTDRRSLGEVPYQRCKKTSPVLWAVPSTMARSAVDPSSSVVEATSICPSSFEPVPSALFTSYWNLGPGLDAGCQRGRQTVAGRGAPGV
jgi:hypothetical protein